MDKLLINQMRDMFNLGIYQHINSSSNNIPNRNSNNYHNKWHRFCNEFCSQCKLIQILHLPHWDRK